MAYLSLPHSSINASKSSHLNSWKILQFHLFYSSKFYSSIPLIFLLVWISSRVDLWRKHVKGSEYCCHSSDCCFWNLILLLCRSMLAGICYSSLKLCEKVKSWISFCQISEVCSQTHIQGVWLFLLSPSSFKPANHWNCALVLVFWFFVVWLLFSFAFVCFFGGRNVCLRKRNNQLKVMRLFSVPLWRQITTPCTSIWKKAFRKSGLVFKRRCLSTPD